jgi:hypothetical protein
MRPDLSRLAGNHLKYFGKIKLEKSSDPDWFLTGFKTGCAILPIPLTLNPSPRAGEGLQASPAPLLLTWAKGLGNEGRLKVAHCVSKIGLKQFAF